MMHRLLSIWLVLTAFALCQARLIDTDTDGQHINAHGGCILADGDTWYWYGESRGNGGNVAVYTSHDLEQWQNRGFALTTVDSVGHDIERGCNIERPKVVRNPRTGQYVMWFHLELKGQGYAAARYGVAVADNPLGPFLFLRSGRANPGIPPINGLSADRNYCRRDLQGGQMCRDQTIFVDSDSTAWHIYSSEENYTLHIARLTDDYLSHTGQYIRVFPWGHNEAPCIYKDGDTYVMITSGCTGWEPNAARLSTARHMLGPWTAHGNPCQGPGADRTFGAQGCYIFTHPTQGSTMMLDIWHPDDLPSSQHLWLPISDGDLEESRKIRNFAEQTVN